MKKFVMAPPYRKLSKLFYFLQLLAVSQHKTTIIINLCGRGEKMKSLHQKKKIGERRKNVKKKKPFLLSQKSE